MKIGYYCESPADQAAPEEAEEEAAMTRPFVTLGLLLVAAASAAPPDNTDRETPRNRNDRWQRDLDGWNYQFRPEEASALYSFGQYVGKPRLQMIFDSEKWWGVTFRFGPDGKLLELQGHGGSVFAESNNVFFFAAYNGGGCGCAIAAYDLGTGKRLWETPLEVVGPVEHSAYRNEINLGLPFGPYGKDQVLCVTGHESYGDYRVILDMKTGESIAQKVYRKGWK